MTTPATTPAELLTELLWCYDNGNSGPRTKAALASVISHLSLATPSPGKAPEPVAWMHNAPGRVDVIHADVKKLLRDSHEAAGHLHRPLDKSERYTIPLYASPGKAEATAKQRYDELGVADEEVDPVERLRAFCSLAMSSQDWLDVEPFFDAIQQDK